MPLNIEDSEEKKGKAGPEQPPQPASREGMNVPSGGGPGTRALLWILVTIVVVSLVFLLVQFGVISVVGDGADSGAVPEPPGSGETVIEQAPPETTTAPAPVMNMDSLRRAELKERMMREGRYTIFISAFRSESDAEEVAGRWVEAGFSAFVQKSDGWFRVALGRYPGENEARAEAERLKEAFEEGYWIGTVGQQ